ncbi:MAG: hypothetical protein LBF42_03580 [Puniceicoccales bacterium]|nr:hypothetical protein [Puniceicoccales bacterium]
MSISKKILTFGCLLFASTSVPAKSLFTPDGELSNGCIALCKALEIEVATPQEFNGCFQRCFLRKGEECYKDFNEKAKRNFGEFIAACNSLGMFEEVLPRRDSYDYIVILGGDTEPMERKCSFLKNELESILANSPSVKIYFLAGARPLNWQTDSVALEWDLLEEGLELTEANAAKLMWKNFFGRSPLQCDFVDVEIDPVSKKRPGTATMCRLLEEHAYPPGTMLLISVNPFIAYQDTVFRNIYEQKGWFASGGSLETVGYGVDVDHYCQRSGVNFVVNVLLDTIAKRAFEEMKFWGGQ